MEKDGHDCIARGWAGEDSRAPANDTRGKCTDMETITMTPRASATNGFSLVKIPQSSQVQAGGGSQGRQKRDGTEKNRQEEQGGRRCRGCGGAELTWELTWVLEALDEIWALCSARPQSYSSTTWSPAAPSNSQQGSRAAGQQGQSLTRQIGIVVPG